jgi:hypothetical protein
MSSAFAPIMPDKCGATEAAPAQKWREGLFRKNQGLESVRFWTGERTETDKKKFTAGRVAFRFTVSSLESE